MSADPVMKGIALTQCVRPAKAVRPALIVMAIYPDRSRDTNPLPRNPGWSGRGFVPDPQSRCWGSAREAGRGAGRGAFRRVIVHARDGLPKRVLWEQFDGCRGAARTRDHR